MNILITGHTGFLGSHIVEKCLQNHNVVGISRTLKPHINYTQHQCDIFNIDQIVKIIQKESIDIIIHSAGKAILSECTQDPFDAFKINGLGTASILESARKTNIKKVIVVETDRIYDNININVIYEEREYNFKNTPYDFSKILAAQICEYYRNYYHLNVISVRPVNVFGPGDTNIRLVPEAMKSILSNKGIPIQYEAQYISKNFIYVKDVADMIFILCENNNKHQIYNLSTYPSINILNFAKLITTTLNHQIEPEILNDTNKLLFKNYQHVNGDRFLNEFDFKITPLEIAILDTYTYYEKSNLSILGR